MVQLSGAQLSGPRVPPARGGAAEQLVVLCHGYGADGNDLISLAGQWRQFLPGAAFAAPNAPMRCEASPAGYQWFPITRRDPEEMSRGVALAAAGLNGFLDQELARLGLDGGRLALAGFSQGTMMALHVGLRRAVPPAAIVGFSGALAGPGRLADECTGAPPILMVHGDADDMIPVAAMHEAVQALGKAGLAVQWHVAQGVGHGIDPQGCAMAGRFLADAFGSPVAAG